MWISECTTKTKIWYTFGHALGELVGINYVYKYWGAWYLQLYGRDEAAGKTQISKELSETEILGYKLCRNISDGIAQGSNHT